MSAIAAREGRDARSARGSVAQRQAPMFTVMDFGAGVFGYALAPVAHSTGLDMAGLFPIVMIGNGLWMLFAIYVIVRKGQPLANSFGPPPALAQLLLPERAGRIDGRGASGLIGACAPFEKFLDRPALEHHGPS